MDALSALKGCLGLENNEQKWYTGAGTSWVVSDLVLAWYGIGYTLKTLLPSPFGGG